MDEMYSNALLNYKTNKHILTNTSFISSSPLSALLSAFLHFFHLFPCPFRAERLMSGQVGASKTRLFEGPLSDASGWE